MDTSVNAIRTLAPDDVRIGDVVVVLARHVDPLEQAEAWELAELIAGGRELPPRRAVPNRDAEPMRVELVAVPLLWARTATDELRTLDFRLLTLGRVEAPVGDAILAARAAEHARAKAEAERAAAMAARPAADERDASAGGRGLLGRLRRWRRGGPGGSPGGASGDGGDDGSR